MFLEQQHPVSRRYAILEDNGNSCWLYLTTPDKPRPEKDCFLYSPVEPSETLNIDAIRNDGEPPVLTIEFATDDSALVDPAPDSFSLLWTDDGESVAVHFNGIAIAMISSENDRGFSKALAKSGFYGEPWNPEVFERVFAET